MTDDKSFNRARFRAVEYVSTLGPIATDAVSKLIPGDTCNLVMHVEEDDVEIIRITVVVEALQPSKEQGGREMSEQAPKKMQLVADVTFYAENIDDAFEQWCNHFSALLNDDDTEHVIGFVGKISIDPVKHEDEK